MRRNLFLGLRHKTLTLIAMALILASGAWAQPRYKVLATIDGGLWSGLTFDSKGNLYGVTTGGGDYGVGSIFEMTRNSRGGWTVTTLHSFDGTYGSSPNGSLIFDESGNLYGTSPDGGAYDSGTVFELMPGSDGWTFTVIHSFCVQYGCPDGESPSAGLVVDNGRNLYGTAGGGSYGWGVAFELTRKGPSGWSETVLYSFAGPPNDGGELYDPLIFDGADSLYGTSRGGGLYGGGTAFRLRDGPDGWKDHVLYNFCTRGGACADGVWPLAPLVFDSSGNLYGTTSRGGRTCYGGCGTVFTLMRNVEGRWVHTVLYNFAKPPDGFEPITAVVFDKAGNLYGTTATGGAGSCFDGCGVVYKLAPDAAGRWIYTVLHEFSSPSESPPDGTLIIDAKGNLYGTALSVVYEITP